MELKQLQTIKSILDEGSFLKAAEKLGYVQSTITLHIQQLEEELGIKLFEKAGRRMLLSQEGAFFWAYAQSLLERADSLKEIMCDYSSGQTGHIRLGAIGTVGKTLLTPKLIDFCKNHPDMKLTLEYAGTASISRQVASNQLDIGICPAPSADLSLAFEPLFLEPMNLLLCEKHPLARKEEIFLEELSGINVLLTEPFCSYRTEVEQHFSTAGVHLNSLIQISDIGTIIQFVQAGIGCAILPVSVIDPPSPMTVRRSLADAEFGLKIGMIRRKERLGKITEKLYSQLLAELKSENF